MSGTPRFWYGPAGALLCDRAISDITHALHGDMARIYGAPFYVAEGCTRTACEKIAKALGGTFTYTKPECDEEGKDDQNAG
jgi:hypothetical protein